MLQLTRGVLTHLGHVLLLGVAVAGGQQGEDPEPLGVKLLTLQHRAGVQELHLEMGEGVTNTSGGNYFIFFCTLSYKGREGNKNKQDKLKPSTMKT